MTDALILTNTALDRLKKNADRSLDDLVAARTKRSLLLVDVSGSMVDRIKTGERKIDALRTVVTELRLTHPVPVAAFGLRGSPVVDLVDTIPEPQGMTPLHKGIDYGHEQGATHLIVVTDGSPDSEGAAFDAAKRFGGPIDVFYIGDGHDRGAIFCRELARMTGGSCGLTDLVGSPKVLAGRIQLMLGDGSEVL